MGGVKTFWLQNDTDACSYLFDFESMQRHNISTGYRRSIRFRDQEPSFIDLTDDKNTNCNLNTATTKKQAVNVCGPAFEGGWVCGTMAEKKLAKIRQLNLQRSPLVSEISRLPECQQVFDPVPISPCDDRFPIEQIKHLNFGGLTVHEVRPTRMWKRNRSHFDLLLEEEKEFFSAYKQPNKTSSLCIGHGMAPLQKASREFWSAVSCPYRAPEWAASMVMVYIFLPNNTHSIRRETASVLRTLKDSNIYCCARCCLAARRFPRRVRHIRAARSCTAEWTVCRVHQCTSFTLTI